MQSRRKDGTGTIKPSGYLLLSVNGKQIREHLIIAETALGRLLIGSEEVHHVNGNRSDNRNENLVICPDRAYHMLLHQRQRALDASGNATFRRCKFCKEYSDPHTMAVYGTSAYHYRCFNAWRSTKGYTDKRRMNDKSINSL